MEKYCQAPFYEVLKKMAPEDDIQLLILHKMHENKEFVTVYRQLVTNISDQYQRKNDRKLITDWEYITFS